MNSGVLTSLIALALAVGLSIPLRAENLISNPGFEGNPQAGGSLEGWTHYVDVGAKAEFQVSGQSHGGKTSASITNISGERCLWQSRRVPVVPGEKLSVSVWVKGENFNAGQGGSATFSIACLDSEGLYFTWLRFGDKDIGSAWRQLHAEMTIPPQTAFVVMQLGHNHSTGTLLFDDASLTAEHALALRLEAPPEIEPGTSEIPLTIINRDGRKGPAVARVWGGKTQAEERVELSGTETQATRVRLAVTPGGLTLRAELLDESGSALANAPDERVRVLQELEMEPPVPTHFCIEDGKPRVSERLWAHGSREDLKGARVRLQMRSPESSETPEVEVEARNGQIDLELEAPSLLSDWEISASLILPDGRTIKQSQDWHIIRRSDARVTLSDSGFPVVQGKAFYPLGTFNSGKYELMKKTGFNTVHAWNRARTAGGLHPHHQPAKDFLDDAEKAGMMAVLMLPGSLAREGKWDEYRRRIRMFRNHPALLAWDEEEGVARGEIKPATLKKMVDILREEDTNHPFCLADSYDTIRNVDRTKFFPDALMDIGMWWYYPIPLENAQLSPLDGQDQPSATLELRPPIFLAQAHTKKPLWVGLQAYRNKKRPDTRLPTPQEYRAMAYLTVVYGAKGLLYYMGPSAAVTEGEKDPARPWGYLHTLVPEIASLAPVLTTAPITHATDVQQSPISQRLWKKDGVYTLIAVNRTKAQVSEQLSAPGAGSVTVMGEDRSLSAEAGVLHDSFEPYAVHIYQWPL